MLIMRVFRIHFFYFMRYIRICQCRSQIIKQYFRIFKEGNP